MNKILTPMATLNLALSWWLAINHTDISTVCLAYCATFVFVSQLELLDKTWLLIMGRGKRFALFRSLVTWPIDLVEFQIFRRRSKRISQLAAIKRQRDFTPAEILEADQLHRKLAVFSERYKEAVHAISSKR